MWQPEPPLISSRVDTVIHAAAETAGGWPSISVIPWMRPSICRGAAAVGIKHFVHVSSLAVLAQGRDGRFRTIIHWNRTARGSGALRLGKVGIGTSGGATREDLRVSVKVIRLGALVDYRDFHPPSHLGKRLGNILWRSARPAIGLVWWMSDLPVDSSAG